MGSTFLGRIWRVRLETWKRIHIVTFLILTAAFMHSLGIGSDLYGINRLIWIILWGLHVAVLAGKVVLKIVTWNRLYKVQKVIPACPGTTTLIMDETERS